MEELRVCTSFSKSFRKSLSTSSTKSCENIKVNLEKLQLLTQKLASYDAKRDGEVQLQQVEEFVVSTCEVIETSINVPLVFERCGQDGSSLTDDDRDSYVSDFVLYHLLVLRYLIRDHKTATSRASQKKMLTKYIQFLKKSIATKSWELSTAMARIIHNILQRHSETALKHVNWENLLQVLTLSADARTMTLIVSTLWYHAVKYRTKVAGLLLKKLRAQDVVIPILVECTLRKNPGPKFPLGKQRCVLIYKILAFLHVLAVESGGDSGIASLVRPEQMDQMGYCLTYLLLQSSTNPEMKTIKKYVINLLTEMPNEYTNFLVLNRCLPALQDILYEQLHEYHANIKNVGVLLPILMVLTKIVRTSPYAQEVIKRFIFPNPLKKVIPPKTKGSNDAADAAPEDAPPGSLRLALITCMTGGHSREIILHMGTFLSATCGSNNEFIRRTGFGNCANYLVMKGLIKV
eukprot:g3329.t1